MCEKSSKTGWKRAHKILLKTGKSCVKIFKKRQEMTTKSCWKSVGKDVDIRLKNIKSRKTPQMPLAEKVVHLDACSNI